MDSENQKNYSSRVNFEIKIGMVPISYVCFSKSEEERTCQIFVVVGLLVEEMTMNCSSLIGHLFDTVIDVSTERSSSIDP